MRKLSTIRKITNIFPIENADKIECAKVDGWNTVVGKGVFNIGDYGVYFEIDSLLPITNDAYSFLKIEKKFEGKTYKYIKTIRFLGQISQGLLLPLSSFPEILDIVGDSPEDFLEDDFSELLGVIKYEHPSETVPNGLAKGVFPSYIRKTGENRIQNIFDSFKEKYKNVEFIPTLKMDGSSITVAYVNEAPYFLGKDTDGMIEQVWVASHNLVLKEPLEIDGETIVRKNGFFDAVDSIGLRDNIADWCRKNNTQIAIQGELLGPKIQGNFEKFNNYTIRAFYVYFINENRRATPDEFIKICSEIGVDTVTHYPPMKVFEIFENVEELINYAEGDSVNHSEREGLVFKSNLIENGEPISFKVISNSFLLKKRY